MPLSECPATASMQWLCGCMSYTGAPAVHTSSKGSCHRPHPTLWWFSQASEGKPGVSLCTFRRLTGSCCLTEAWLWLNASWQAPFSQSVSSSRDPESTVALVGGVFQPEALMCLDPEPQFTQKLCGDLRRLLGSEREGPFPSVTYAFKQTCPCGKPAPSHTGDRERGPSLSRGLRASRAGD